MARRAKKAEKKNLNQKKLLIGVGAAVVAVVVVFLCAGMLLPNDCIANNVYVGEVSLGGMTMEEAEAAIAKANITLEEPLGITSAGHTLTIKPEEISLIPDLKATVERAYSIGKSNNWIENSLTFFRLLFSKEELYCVPAVDEEALGNILYSFGATFNGEYSNYEVKVGDGELILIPGKLGQNPDTQAARAQILESIENGVFEPIEIILEKTEPLQITEEELRTRTAEAKDATFEYEGNEVRILEHVVGLEITDAQLTEKIANFNLGHEVRIEATTVQPAVTADALRAKLFNTTLASYSTTYSTKTVNRAANVALAASKIDGTVLEPGEVFSYNETIGDTTLANGYKVATIFENGKTSEGVGGGICQVSTTLYSAVLYADLEVVERRNHSLTVAYAPKGQDATVSYGAIDFKFKNDTDYPVKIVSKTGGGKVTVSLVGTKREVDRKVELTHTIVSSTAPTVVEVPDPSLPLDTKKVISSGKTGYVVNTVKTVYENGEKVSSKQITKSTYKMVPTEMAVGTMPAAETQAPETVPTDGTVTDSTAAPTQTTTGTENPAQTEKPKATEKPETTPAPTESTPAETEQPVKETKAPARPSANPTEVPEAVE